MHKNLIRTYGVLAILFAVLTVVVFAVPFVKNGVFWVSYLFALISIVLQGYAIHKGFSRDEPLASKFYGFPVAQVGLAYMVVQLILSLLFMALAALLPLWVTLVVYSVALGAAGVGLITTDAMREEILRQDEVLKKNVSLMRALQSKTRMLPGQCANPEVAAQLSSLAEAVQYSDPVSSESLQQIEYDLAQLVDELQKAVVEQEYSAAKELIKKAENTLVERNRLCKLNK